MGGERSLYVQTSHPKSYRSPVKANSSRLEETEEERGWGGGCLSVWVSAAQRKWGGVTGETKAASGSPLGTKPFLQVQQAGCSSAGWRHQQRQTDYV